MAARAPRCAHAALRDRRHCRRRLDCRRKGEETSMKDCIFCRIARGEIPAAVVRRTDDAIAFHDVDPQAPTHVLVIPRSEERRVGKRCRWRWWWVEGSM